ncbi:MAG: efflux RND transporter periplasmic adaptor subunit [Nitrospirae bacterium]|nr:efflux RND transporter periplasmic adaptor subunit [Nitrospirota bacterium]
MKRAYLLSLLVLLTVLCITGSSCSKGKPAPPRTVPVVVGSADQKNIPLQLKVIGNVEAYNAVSIKPLVGGEVEGVYFREGQDVKKGDLLFKIDPRPYAAALRQSEAALARDLAQAKNAEEQAKRYALLVQKDYVSKDQYDQLRANADALAAAVQADKANVENSRLQLDYCSIKSPINGRAGSVMVNAGNVIKANDSAMTTINRIVPIYVTFTVPEQNLSDINKYTAMHELKVEAIIPGDEKRPARGELTFIDNEVDKTTGTLKLKGTFANADRRLWPGQFVDVILTLTTEPNRVVVPSSAVQTGQQGQYVYVIKDDMTADLRIVTPGRSYGEGTIIEKGVAVGEKVVIDGQLRLVPGAKVEIKNEKDNKAEKNDNHGDTETRSKEDLKTQMPKSK